MENIFYFPRIGKNYETKGFNNIKLLVLGESHYCGDRGKCEVCGVSSKRKDCNNFTIRVVEDGFLSYKKGEGKFEDWMRTFTRFTNVLLGDQANNDALHEFWDSIIFYNYVQSSTTSPRVPPTQEQFEESEIAFFEVLNQYTPDLIIVWGYRLWDNLGNGRWGEERILDDPNQRFYYYKIAEKEIPAFPIYHPSTSKFGYDTTKYLKEVIRLVQSKKNS